jgi:hypothetical protein
VPLRSSRVRIGFRRIELVLVFPFATVAVIMAGFALYALATMPPAGIAVRGPDHQWFKFQEGTSAQEISADLTRRYGRRIQVGNMEGPDSVVPTSTQMWAWNDAETASSIATIASALGGLVYLVIWAIGWIVAGFAGDNDKAS